MKMILWHLTGTAALLLGPSLSQAADPPPGANKNTGVYPTALFVFEERGPSAKEYGAKVSDLLYARLGTRPNIALVEREDLKRVLEEAELNLSGAVKPSEATQVGQLTGAKILVTGSVMSEGKKLYLVAKVIGTETSRVLPVSVEGQTSDDLLPLAEKLADKVAVTITQHANQLVASPATQKDQLAELVKKLKQAKHPSVWVKIGDRSVSATTIDPAVQTEFTLLCKEGGFVVIDPDEGLQSQAEVLITGEGISELAGHLGNLVTVKARVEVKAVDRKTGQVLAVDRQTARVVDLSEQLAGKAALQEAADRIAERLLPKLVQE
ncbi:MAG: hypothetical protein JO112_08040 [Planctomycetes bacterium]|nr:hypothetical protein [Planctomycetota bacterium]